MCDGYDVSGMNRQKKPPRSLGCKDHDGVRIIRIDRAKYERYPDASGAPVEAVAFLGPRRCTMKLFIGLCADEHVSLGAVLEFSHSG